MEIKSSTSTILVDLALPRLVHRVPQYKRATNPKTLTPLISHKHPTSLKPRQKRDTSFFKFSSPRLKLSPGISLPQKLKTKPFITADSWAILELSSHRYLDGKNDSIQREIASLSKMMTCLTVIQEIGKRKRSFEEVTRVSENAVTIDGTIAGLAEGDEVKIWDLLHGLMLPSGNDAALALAEFIGLMAGEKKEPVEGFVKIMNQNAKDMGLEDTCFSNPHGMSTSINLSSAKNLALLGCIAMKNHVFQRVVNAKKHACSIYNPNGVRKIEWVNTNVLLEKGFKGVKTGITPAAGPCLCFCIEHKKKSIVGVLLNSRTLEARWSEAHKLWKYCSSYLL
jgi:serine-type D-Ala-D-Ala carboxypeptidase (penicillin-binding protein 5/6)